MKSDQYVEAMLQSIAKTERHIRSEYGTRMVGVMDTIGAHPHFAMPQQPGVVTVISGRHDVDEMYKASVQLAAPQGSRLLSQLATDWYVFADNVPTRLWIEGNTLVTVQTITMFVTDDENGLTGEYAWQRLYPPQISPCDGSIPLPERELHNLELHQSLLDALCKGEATGFVAGARRSTPHPGRRGVHGLGRQPLDRGCAACGDGVSPQGDGGHAQTALNVRLAGRRGGLDPARWFQTAP